MSEEWSEYKGTMWLRPVGRGLYFGGEQGYDLPIEDIGLPEQTTLEVEFRWRRKAQP